MTAHWSMADPAAGTAPDDEDSYPPSSAPPRRSRLASSCSSPSCHPHHEGEAPMSPMRPSTSATWSPTWPKHWSSTPPIRLRAGSRRSPAFADATRGNLRLLLSGPTSSAGRAMPDGAVPSPGGWNRIHSSSPISTARSPASRAGREVPQRGRQRARWSPDPHRRPFREPHRAVPARGALANPSHRRGDPTRGRAEPARTPGRCRRCRGDRSRVDDRCRRLRRHRAGRRSCRFGTVVGLVIAAIVAYCNATSSARLAARYPTSGGTYVYGRERLGPSGATSPAGASSSARPPAVPPWPSPWVPTPRHPGSDPSRSAAVAALTAVNLRGVRKTAILTRVIVAIVLGALTFVIGGAVFGGNATTDHLGDLTAGGVHGTLQSAGLVLRVRRLRPHRHPRRRGQ